MVPEGFVELPGGTSVAALEEHARVTAGVEKAVLLAGHDDPDADQRILAALGQGDPLGLGPVARRIVGIPDLGPVEGIGRGGEVAPGARVTHRVVDGLAGEGASAHLEAATGGPVEKKE